MTEYIEREAALERIDGIYDCSDIVFEPHDHCCRADDCASCKWRETKNAIRRIVANFRPADVAPVVRCKDCKHSYEELWGRVCSYGVCVDCFVMDDFFCACGAKMEEEEDTE